MEEKIYVIEDDAKNMKLFAVILNTIPEIKLFCEEDGKAGFDLIEKGDPDLIILDIQLPTMNGIEICLKLRKLDKFKKVPIIAVTSFAMKGDKERILSAGFNDYVSKPIRVDSFIELVKKYLKSTNP